MGIAVKPGDRLFIFANGITATLLRGNVNIRPKSWWVRLWQRLVIASGKDDPFNVSVDVTSTTDRSQVNASVDIAAEGEIDSAFIAALTTPPVQTAQVYAWLLVTRAGAGGTFVGLCGGYVSGTRSPSYPDAGANGPPGPAGGPGYMREVLTADPAANNEIAIQSVPANALWFVRSASVVLVQGITQTPLPTLKFNTSVGSPASIPITPVAIAASSTATLTWGVGLVQTSFTAVIGDEFHTAPLPELYLLAVDNFVTVTDGIGANTNYGAMTYTVEEWVMP